MVKYERKEKAMLSKELRELIARRPGKAALGKPDAKMVELAILTLHAQVKAARAKGKGKATPRPRRA
jgi:hypothetical protein